MQNKKAIEFLQKELDAAYKRKEKIGLKYNTKYIIILEMVIKILEQEPCEDVVSREAIHKLYKYTWVDGTQMVSLDDINELPPVTPSRPTERKPICNDCIYFNNGKGNEKCDSCELTGTNKPNRHKGYWIRWYEVKKLKGSKTHIPHCKCSNCNIEYDPYINRFMKYCSNCGYKMENE